MGCIYWVKYNVGKKNTYRQPDIQLKIARTQNSAAYQSA